MTIEKIMGEITPLWGIVSFDKIKEGLINCRVKSRLPENAKSVIVACFPYLLSEESYKNCNISKYAVVADYHDVALKRLNSAAEKLKALYPQNYFSAFADNSPIPEVKAASLANLGVTGINTLLITEKYGSFVFIGEIVTDLKIDCADYTEKKCIGCKKCISACPSGAISENAFNKELCLSHITQKKGSLSPEEEKLMKDCGCVWGCDICQNICPMNKDAATTQIQEFLDSPIPVISSGCSLDGRAYEWRGKGVIERNISIYERRNHK